MGDDIERRTLSRIFIKVIEDSTGDRLDVGQQA